MAKQAKTTGRHGWLHYSCPDGLDGLNTLNTLVKKATVA